MNAQSTDSSPKDEGVRRILGVPVSLSGLTDARARLRGFEPENPDLFVPRTFGAGWDLNVGAVAVKLGLIRPDDSLPDLTEHIPPAAVTALRAAPLLGGAAVLAAGLHAARTHDRLPSNWGLRLTPTRWASGPAAVAAPVLISVASGTWAAVMARRDNDTAGTSVDVTSAAQALGMQSMSLLLIAAATRRADNPQASRLLPAAGLIAAPAVTTGVLVATVRSALRHLDAALRRERTA